jgi:N-acetylneuraminic acid mutarotase
MILRTTVFLFIVFQFFSIEINAQKWERVSDFIGGERDDAVGFSIGNVAYVGTGRDAGFAYRNDFFGYNMLTDNWYPVASMPTVPRQYACAFVINDKGYVFGGVDANNSFLADLWEYSPDTDQWNQKSSLPGVGRAAGVAAVINGKAYVGMGRNSTGSVLDWWEYNPYLDLWSLRSSPPIPASNELVGFTLGDRIFIGFGESVNGISNQFYQYDALKDQWDLSAPFSVQGMTYSIAQGVNYKAYVTTGQFADGAFANEHWVYNYVGNSWNKLEDFPGVARRGVAAFSGENTWYICTGLNESMQRSNETWKYTVDSSLANFNPVFFPSFNGEFFNLTYIIDHSADYTAYLYDFNGKLLFKSTLSATDYFFSTLLAQVTQPVIFRVTQNQELVFTQVFVVSSR